MSRLLASLALRNGRRGAECAAALASPMIYQALRASASAKNARKAAIYLTDCEDTGNNVESSAGPITLGLINYFEVRP
jgi:hypothetical protein